MESSGSSTSAGETSPSEGTTAEASLVSRAVLQQRAKDLGEEGGDLSVLAELVSVFLDVASEDVPALQAHAADGQLDEVKTRAHRLKGASATVGAEVFSVRCQAIEEAAQAGQRDVVQENAETLPELLQETRAEFREVLETDVE